ncbi:MAG: FAD-binding protein [Dinghuibacter sp.]|nr:FAD-binding protein [Dinghuibacter sp.]
MIKNWSGHLKWQPEHLVYPQSHEELAQWVQLAVQQNRKVRVIGSGHSFTPLAVCTDILIVLDKLSGIVSVNQATRQVTVKAGTKLHELNRLLNTHGLALENLGDIDVQSVAGAICTGTHGTGIQFGNLSTQVSQITFINGKGETVTCSETEEVELFKAVQVSLGAFGIITEVTFKCVSSYTLNLQVGKKPLEEVLQQLHHYNTRNRNFEFYWFPHTSWVVTKELNLTDQPPVKKAVKDFFQETVLENYAFKAVCELAHRIPRLTRRISRFSAATIGAYQKTRKSFEVFSTRRLVKFNEMEYNVPAAAYTDVKKEIVQWVNRNNRDVMFPMENRFVQEDDIYLSPAYRRPSAYIAVHVYNKAGFEQYFRGIEAIFRAYNGRPHWGKMHTLQQKELEQLYPMWHVFDAFRRQHDPGNIFLTPYLQTLFT